GAPARHAGPPPEGPTGPTAHGPVSPPAGPMEPPRSRGRHGLPDDEPGAPYVPPSGNAPPLPPPSVNASVPPPAAPPPMAPPAAPPPAAPPRTGAVPREPDVVGRQRGASDGTRRGVASPAP